MYSASVSRRRLRRMHTARPMIRKRPPIPPTTPPTIAPVLLPAADPPPLPWVDIGEGVVSGDPLRLGVAEVGLGVPLILGVAEDGFGVPLTLCVMLLEGVAVVGFGVPLVLGVSWAVPLTDGVSLLVGVPDGVAVVGSGLPLMLGVRLCDGVPLLDGDLDGVTLFEGVPLRDGVSAAVADGVGVVELVSSLVCKVRHYHHHPM